MHYISPNALATAIHPEPLPVIRRTDSVNRGGGTSPLNELIENLAIRLTSPAVLELVQNGSEETLCLLKLGFRLKLPEETRIQWLRFSAEVSHAAREGEPALPGTIISFLPERVTQGVAYDGHIGVDDGGIIQRRLTAPQQGTPAFLPYALGYLTRPNRLVWDFLPQGVSGIPGSDQLLVTARMPKRREARFLEAVQLCVAHRRYGQGTFEYSPTTKIVLIE
jgi:hypothetical protein